MHPMRYEKNLNRSEKTSHCIQKIFGYFLLAIIFFVKIQTLLYIHAYAAIKHWKP